MKRLIRTTILPALAACLVSACTATTQLKHPDFGEDCTVLASAPEASHIDCVRVYYGTNRTLSTQGPQQDVVNVSSTPSTRLNLGRADVWLPKLIEKGGTRERGQTPQLQGDIPEDRTELNQYVFLTRITAEGRERFTVQMQDAVDGDGGGSVLLFIHGFNVDFEPALIRSAQLSVDLGRDGAFNPGAPVLFSWPSAGKMSLSNYRGDQRASAEAAPYLTEFLDLLTKDIAIDRINIIAHSMGNRVLTRSLEDYAANYVHRNPDAPVEFRIILAAADVDADVFDQTTGVLDKLDPNVTIYTSDADRALQVSKVLNRAARLGDTNGNRPYIRQSDTYQTVDATGVATELFGLGHGYYSDNPFVLGDMLCSLLEAAPEDRALQRKRYEDNPAGLEFFAVSTDLPPKRNECSLYRATVPGDGTVAPAPPPAGVMLPPPLVSTPAPPVRPRPRPPGRGSIIIPEPAPTPLAPWNTILYYDSGQVALSRDTLNTEIAPQLDAAPISRVVIKAYTDTSGSDANNIALSFARADSIRDWMAERGVPADRIDIIAFGETGLAVETPDNVSEPQNRRVEIMIEYE